jgi:hypothetical protein
LIDEYDASLFVNGYDCVGCGLGHCTKLVLALPKRGFYLLAFGELAAQLLDLIFELRCFIRYQQFQVSIGHEQSSLSLHLMPDFSALIGNCDNARFSHWGERICGDLAYIT